jgi:hypothetical protein
MKMSKMSQEKGLHTVFCSPAQACISVAKVETSVVTINESNDDEHKR